MIGLAAVLGYHRSTWEAMTLRELIISHDAIQVERWWHTAVIASQIYNLQTIVANIMSKKKVKPKSPSEFHPFVNPKPQGMKIKSSNFSTLKALGNALCRR